MVKMQQSNNNYTYTLRSNYTLVNLTTNNSTNVDNLIRQLKQRYDELLQHCIFPLALKFNVTAEVEDPFNNTNDNDEEETIVVKLVANIITEDTINCERLVERIEKDLAIIANGYSGSSCQLQLASCNIR